MASIKTPNDFGQAIREQRRALGWDQATLARQVGVSRQWVIDIEKGKPRAELELALRTLRVLGLTLTTMPKHQVVSPVGIPSAEIRPADIDRIADANAGRLPSADIARRLHDVFVVGPDEKAKGRKRPSKSAARPKKGA